MTIMPMAEKMSGAGGDGRRGIRSRRTVVKPRAGTARADQPAGDTKSARGSEPQALPVEPIEKSSDNRVALVSALAASAEYK
ncbi:MAG TPA: hypothetical protein VKR81_00060, partial [Candidatus Binatia bacterium]|nr:hypothetical protein [Candidatus Binatia bacterium]